MVEFLFCAHLLNRSPVFSTTVENCLLRGKLHTVSDSIGNG